MTKNYSKVLAHLHSHLCFLFVFFTPWSSCFRWILCARCSKSRGSVCHAIICSPARSFPAASAPSPTCFCSLFYCFDFSPVVPPSGDTLADTVYELLQPPSGGPPSSLNQRGDRSPCSTQEPCCPKPRSQPTCLMVLQGFYLRA